MLSNVKWHKCTDDQLQSYSELCEQVFNRDDIEDFKHDNINTCIDILVTFYW